jgi:drug/metabolite transporter (DMT)-like permease
LDNHQSTANRGLRAKAEALLVLITLIWGSTFVIVKGALQDATSFAFIALRFVAAGLLLYGLLARGRVAPTAVLPGITLGVFLFGGYAFQTSGLALTTPSKAAFITGFSVILVPLLVMVGGTRLRPANIGGALLGLAGLYFLVVPSGFAEVNRGDLMVLVGAVSFALHIVMVGVYARKHSFLHLVPLQVLTVGALASLALPVVSGLTAQASLHVHWTARLVIALIVTAVFATGVAFSVQNWAQQYTPAAHTALIFALEPVFAALTSWAVIGERLGGKTLLGSALILAGMVVSEVWGGASPAPVEG